LVRASAASCVDELVVDRHVLLTAELLQVQRAFAHACRDARAGGGEAHGLRRVQGPTMLTAADPADMLPLTLAVEPHCRRRT